MWPNGFTGSLTHKGTVVLGAISNSAANSGIGIDLERDDGKSLSEIRGLVGINEIPAGSSITPLILFSAKEAIFKAQFSVSKAHIEFGDVRISWRSASDIFRGQTKLKGGIAVEVSVSRVDKWVVSGARVI